MPALYPRRLVVLLCGLTMAVCLQHGHERWEADSFDICDDLHGALKWWAEGHHGRMPMSHPYAVFQYLTGLPAVALSRAGIGVDTFGWWITLNRLGLAAIVGIFLWAGVRRRAALGGTLAALCMLAGPFVFYASSSFNEPTAAAVTVLFAAACCMGWPRPWRVVLFILAGLTKETAAPLLLLLWAGALFCHEGHPWRREAPWVAGATLVTLCAHAGFNFLRFGTLSNSNYLAHGMVVESWRWRAEYAVALWWAPNGGIVWFWPGFVALAAMVAGKVRRGPALCAGAVLLGVTGLLCAWYSPFGWWCWGPRLALPWLPAVLFVLFWFGADAFERLAVGLTRTLGRRVALGAGLALLALPHAMLATSAVPISDFFTSPEPARSSDAVLRQHQGILFDAWEKRPLLLLRPLMPPFDLKGRAASLGYVAAIAMLAMALSPEALRRRERPLPIALPPGI